MNVCQTYFDFLARQEAKQKIQAIIMDGINKWKKEQASYFDAEANNPGDNSGQCFPNGDKTIGDIAHSDIEVLDAYTGDSKATYTSRFVFRCRRVFDEIEQDVNSCISSLHDQFIQENAEELFEEYGIESEADWTEDDILENIEEAILSNDYGLNTAWMEHEFPEYTDYRGKCIFSMNE